MPRALPPSLVLYFCVVSQCTHWSRIVWEKKLSARFVWLHTLNAECVLLALSCIASLNRTVHRACFSTPISSAVKWNTIILTFKFVHFTLYHIARQFLKRIMKTCRSNRKTLTNTRTDTLTDDRAWKKPPQPKNGEPPTLFFLDPFIFGPGPDGCN